MKKNIIFCMALAASVLGITYTGYASNIKIQNNEVSQIEIITGIKNDLSDIRKYINKVENESSASESSKETLPAEANKPEKPVEIKSEIKEPENKYNIDPTKPMIALTFDDGPNPAVTNRILETLKNNDGRATFFVVGDRVKEYKDSLSMAVEQGCEIGNHSYDHAMFTKLDAKQIKYEIDETDKIINEVIGKNTDILRPTYGAVNDVLKKNCDKPLILWDIDTLDWKTKNAGKTTKAVLDYAKDGDIVLMHDLYSATADAVDIIVPKLKERGFQLVTVSELAQYKKITLSPSQIYSKIK